MRKDTAWRWGASQMKAFKEAKKMLHSAFLTHFNLSKSILVQVNASPYGLGATMEVRNRYATFHERFMILKRIMPTAKREVLVLVFAMKKLHQYLHGNSFTIFLDHKTIVGTVCRIQTNPPFCCCQGSTLDSLPSSTQL